MVIQRGLHAGVEILVVRQAHHEGLGHSVIPAQVEIQQRAILSAQGFFAPPTRRTGSPEVSNEVQHRDKVLLWDESTISLRLRRGALLPGFVKADNRTGKPRQLWIATALSASR